MEIQPLILSDVEEVEIDDNAEEEKLEIQKQFEGVIEYVDLFKAQVLVAIFQRDKLAKDSKILTANITKKEDVYQGRVGLVLKCGPLAFVDSKDVQFAGKRADPGDWVFYVPANGTRMMVGGNECRILEDVNIDGKVDDPYVLL